MQWLDVYQQCGLKRRNNFFFFHFLNSFIPTRSNWVLVNFPSASSSSSSYYSIICGYNGSHPPPHVRLNEPQFFKRQMTHFNYLFHVVVLTTLSCNHRQVVGNAFVSFSFVVYLFIFNLINLGILILLLLVGDI